MFFLKKAKQCHHLMFVGCDFGKFPQGIAAGL
jgi:hypothetical protein